MGCRVMGASRLARRSSPALCCVAYCGSGWCDSLIIWIFIVFSEIMLRWLAYVGYIFIYKGIYILYIGYILCKSTQFDTIIALVRGFLCKFVVALRLFA